MALLINKATPAGTDQVENGDNEIRALKEAIQDIFGVPDNTTISTAVLGINAAGEITTLANIKTPVLINSGADSFLTYGMVVNQGANSDFVSIYKASTITQPVTTQFTPGTFGAIGQVSNGIGGLNLYGITDAAGAPPLVFEGFAAVANATKTASGAVPVVLLKGHKSDGGTGVAALASTDNLWGVANGDGNVVLIGGGDGSLRLRPGVSGIGPNVNYDDIVIEAAAGLPAGISFLTPTNTTAQTIAFGDPEDNDIGRLVYDHNTDEMGFMAGARYTWDVAGVEGMRFDGDVLFIGDTANADMTRGITVNMQDAPFGSVSGLDIKHNNCNHPFTSLAEADTGMQVGWALSSSDAGYIEGFGNNDTGVMVFGVAATEQTTKGAAARAAVEARGNTTDGGDSTQALATDGNVFGVFNGSSCQFIVDAEGDLHVNGAGTLAVYDDYDDVQLVTALKGLMTKDINFKSRYADWIEQHAPVLAAGGVITLNDDGHHFVSYKGMSGLLIDTIRQLSGRIENLEREQRWIRTRWQRVEQFLKTKSTWLKKMLTPMRANLRN